MSRLLDVVDFIGLFAALIGSLILVPICLYTLIQFYKLRRVDMIKNRRIKLVYYMNILAIFGLLFQWAKLNRNVFGIYMNDILTQLIYIIDGIFIWSIMSLFCIKTWLLFYDKQYHEANADQIWKTQINKEYKSWFELNKNKWGNFDYIIKIIVIPLLLCVCLESILEVMFLLKFNINSMIILSIIWLPPSCILQCVYLKGFDDIFGIKKEILYQIILMIIILFIHIIPFLFQIRNVIYVNDNTLIHRIDSLLAIILSSITLFSISFISTVYPIYLHKNKQKELNIMNLQHNSSSSTNIKGWTWTDMLNILSHKKGFQVFMKHLCHEFATENLLFVVELIQIKSDFFDNNSYINDMINIVEEKGELAPTMSLRKRASFLPKTMSLHSIPIEAYIFSDNNNKKPWGKIRFPSSLPQTELVIKYATLFEQFNALYNKYVFTDSPLTINISYGTRKRLDLFFNPPEPEGMTENKKQIILEQIKGLKLFRLQSDSVFPNQNDNIDSNSDHDEININPLHANINTRKQKHPNTPRASPKIKPMDTNNIINDEHHRDSPRLHTPSHSKSKSKEKSLSKSLKNISISLPKHSHKKAYQRTPSGKLPQDLAEPIIEKDNFPDVELSMKSGTKSEHELDVDELHLNMDFSPSPNLNRDDIPEDFMVILDYNMDECEEEKEENDNNNNNNNNKEIIEQEEINKQFNFEETENKENNSEIEEDEIDKEEMFELFNIMDSACVEIIALMFGSYSRFSVSPNGKQLIKELI